MDRSAISLILALDLTFARLLLMVLLLLLGATGIG